MTLTEQTGPKTFGVRLTTTNHTTALTTLRTYSYQEVSKTMRLGATYEWSSENVSKKITVKKTPSNDAKCSENFALS